MEELQKLYDVLVREGKYTKSFEEFQTKWGSDQSYQSKVFDVVSRDGLYTKDKNSFLQKYSVNAVQAEQPTVDVVKKKDTTGLPSEDGSSVVPSQSVKDKQAVLTKRALAKYEEDNQKPFSSPAGKALLGTLAVVSEANKSIYQFADELIVSARKGLQEEGFFDDDIPDTNTPITDAMKKKLSPKKGEMAVLSDELMKPKVISDAGPLDPTPIIRTTAKLALKVINSAMPQAQKNAIIYALNLGDADLKKRIKEVEYVQDYALPKDNLAVNVAKGVMGMVPDLAAAALMKNPAAAEGRLSKLAANVSEGAKPLIKKYAPKVAKFVEEAVSAPFTKIMAAKGVVSGIANAKDGEDIVGKGIEGGIEGAKEGVYMHSLGVAAGKAMPVIAKQISRTGMNSAFATAIANPLANAGVFSTAKAIRTPIETGELATGDELIMEAATGVGFSLLHAGSLYKNHNELNHYYDNTLKTDPLESFGRVVNETKDNLELVYNPDLTDTQIKDLEEARDELKTAIIKEPDLNNKKLMGDEALKIQNQLDAHSAIKGIVENKEALIDAINSNEDLSEKEKSQKTKKVAAIADYFDNSEFGIKKKELTNKIDEAQKRLDDAALSFTNLTKQSDRVQAKIELEKRRLELDSLSNELTNLITNKDAVQKQTTNESVLRTEQPELELQGVGEGNAQEETIINAKPEEVIEPSLKVSDALNDPSGVFIHDGKRGQLKAIGKTLVLETPTEVIDIAYDLDNISDQTLEDLGVSQEKELDFKFNEDNSIELNGKKYFNNYSDPESAFSKDKDGNYSVTLDTDNGQKRTFRGQQADQIVYETRLKNFEQNGTERQIEQAHTAADEAIRIEDETRAASPKREGKSVRKGKQRTLKTVKEPLSKAEREVTTEGPPPAPEGFDIVTEQTPVGEAPIKAEVAPVEKIKGGDKLSSYLLNDKQLTFQEGFDLANSELKEIEAKERTLSVQKEYEGKIREINRIKELAAKAELTPIEIQEERVKSAKALVDEAKTKVAKKKAMTDLAAEESRLAEMKAFNKVKAEVAPVEEASIVGPKENKEIAQLENDIDSYQIDVENIEEDIKTETQNTKEGIAEIKKKISEAKKDKSLSKDERLEKVETLESELEDFKDEQEAIIDRYKEDLKDAKAEQRKVQKKLDKVTESKVDEVKGLLDLDTKEKTNLERVSDYLDKLDKSLDLDPNELNDVTRVMAVGTAKAVIKTLKALVNAGKTLQEAIKLASAAHKVREDQILEALDIVSKINENKSEGISEFELPGYNKLSKVIDKAIANGKTIDNILNYMNRSEVYKSATDVQKEALVREVRKRFGLKEKSAPSVNKLFGKLKDVTKITMTEKAALVKQIKDLGRGARDVVKAFNEKKSELTKETDELVKQGKITTQQASNVVKRFAKVNLLSETSVGRFTEYMAKVFNKADYAKKLTDAKDFKKSISKLSKNDEKNVHLTELGKKFAKIDPSMVENIEEYNAIATDVKEAIKGSTKRLEKINWAGTVKIEDVAKYIEKTIKAQDLKLREEKIAELQDLLGVDASTFSAEEIDELLKTDKKMSNKDSLIAKATIEKGFDIYSTMIKEAIKTGKDPLTGEDVSYRPKDVEVIEAFMDMDLNRLTDKQALAAADALHNFLVNESTANMEDVLAKYEGGLNAKEFLTTGGKKGTGRVAVALKKYFSKDLGRFITKKGTPMGDVLVKLFKGVDAAADFSRLSGFNRIARGKMLAITKVENISKDYIKQFFDKKANGEKFNTAYNEAERGIVADLRRSTPGNESAEFKRRVKILDESIKELEKGTPEEQKKAEIYQRVYDKVVEGSKDLSDVEAKTDKNNLAAIEFWQKQHETYFDDLANYMLNIHNTVLEKGVNYSSPDRYAKLSEETPAKLLDNEAMYGAGGEHLYKKEASGLMRAQYPEDLPKGRYRDYSFDKNNVNSMRDALIDMNTGRAIRQLEAFRESPEYKKIIPSVYDRNMLNKRMTDYVANTRNKGDFGGEDFTKIMKILDKTATIGAGMVLGSPLQAVKQTIPIIPNTIANTGKLGLTGAFDPNFNNFLNQSGYATGHRGVESQIEISSLNKKIELAAEGTPAQLAKAIDNASKWWLKTFLVKPDVFMARSSWQAYYEQSLERQGISTKGIDYSKHKLNEKAGDYAEQMVSRQQNVSDHDLAGEWFTKNTPDAKALKKIFLNMASFRMNQSARLGADLTTIGHWSTSTTADKITAARSLAGYGAEMIAFRVLSAAAILGIGSLAKKIKGEDESDVDWEERYKNVLKGQLTSSVVDTFSPAPFLDMGVKAALAPASDKLEEVTGLPLSIYGVQKEDWLQQLGAYGMAPQRLNDIRKAADLGFTGTYEDEFGNVKKISTEDQQTIKELLPFYAATGVGILPSDVATGIKDVIKYSKKKVTTDQEIIDKEISIQEKEEGVDEKLDILDELSKKRLNPKLQEALKEKVDELSVEDPEEKKQLILERKEEREAKEELLVDTKKGKVYDNESDLKKYNKRLWLKNFGPRSKWGKEHKYEKEVDKRLRSELTKREELKNNYKKTTNSDGSSKRKYGSAYGSSFNRVKKSSD